MSTGLNTSEEKREHLDIYAIFEGPQELYFGDRVQINVNLVEQITLESADGTQIKKCYISPTKRRGVERRSLIWAPTNTGALLGDVRECGIPKTCVKQDCPICAIYGAMDAGNSTLIGRLTHGGGVAIQALPPEEKQRAMHPALIARKNEESPTPFRREYNEPGLLYPNSNHFLSVTEKEFTAGAYAFLDSLARVGAGNPKGVKLFEKDNQPMLIVDRYLSPMGKRPILSPHISDTKQAIETFERLARTVHGKLYKENTIKMERFERKIGDDALVYLQTCADQFVQDHLQGS
ncbi:MAG TPA: hypothetical protein DCE42_26590 [Myxococcales bacterium]|nr:hypothetical protein [Deltaproteobacteria bacterium]MBU50985.1 hypothetical protein [Deltaproteobacteria bacterium]HAA58359.1 hypothetical protein [Myxococcales bacterium]|tara:strand:- start:9560 stop:10435 length:876 start_codon:yes stop_codon:yes gene_type:complete